MKHTGMGIMWLNHGVTTTGTFARCDAAIRAAQRHNLAAGWWSLGSVLLWNWIALSTNKSARTTLYDTARAHPYAAHWASRQPAHRP